MSDEFDEALRRIGEEWNKAETAIKLAEQVNGKIVNPAIYELRYAGRKIVEAREIHDADPHRAGELLRDSMMDCLRARHDAVDAATSKITADLDIAVHTLGAKTVLSCFPEWSDMYEAVCAVKEKIAVSRANRTDREAIYATIEAVDLTALVSRYNRFKGSEPLLKKSAQRERLHLVAGYGIGIVGLIFGLICLIA